jgi:tRNA(Ile2)-agmatinylcytidine synthase
MTVVGVDDTDSRTDGMCTTYLAAQLADRFRERGAAVERCLLVRCNPAVEHKTRGNAAVAVHTDAAPDTALAVAADLVDAHAVTDDPTTNPGLVVADGDPDAVPDAVAAFTRAAVRDHHTIAAATDLCETAGYATRSWGEGRGRIGALAAVGAWRAFDDPTYETIVYRPRERWGTDRRVDADSVFAAAEDAYPTVWDTVDRTVGAAVCVPHTPGPVLFGIRGDDPAATERVADAISHEPATGRQTFVTNQGTDAHLQDGRIDTVQDGRSYRVAGTVTEPPETRPGGHVFVTLGDGEARLPCVAFEPTKRFRQRVRRLRVGDRLTVCGELAEGTCKLEKFALRARRETERVTPTCPDCDRRMESAGAGQGYRCRDCSRTADAKVEQAIEREIACGWYEVPPVARRHVAKPLVRGGFDGPTHPER